MAFDTSKNQLAEDLIAARALIDAPEKWCKEALETSRGAFCMIGAINRAKRGDAFHWGSHREPELLALAAALPPTRARLGTPSTAVARFNNAPDVEHRDVLAVFDRAIAKALYP